jgi:hypothetical protein
MRTGSKGMIFFSLQDKPFDSQKYGGIRIYCKVHGDRGYVRIITNCKTLSTYTAALFI